MGYGSYCKIGIKSFFASFSWCQGRRRILLDHSPARQSGPSLFKVGPAVFRNDPAESDASFCLGFRAAVEISALKVQNHGAPFEVSTREENGPERECPLAEQLHTFAFSQQFNA